MKILKITLLAVGCSLTFLFINSNHLKAQSNNSDKNGQTVDLTVRVDNSRPGIQIPSDFLGLSYENTAMTDTSTFNERHLKLINLYNNLGSGILRLNGYYGNFLTWSNEKRTASMSKYTENYKRDSLATNDLDTLFNFLRKTKWKVIIGINILNSSPAATVSEIRYAWEHGKDVIEAFEIGNEPDGLFKNSIDVYNNTFLPHINAIKKEFPSVPLCGPATAHPEGLFFKKFISESPGLVNFITYHDYPINQQVNGKDDVYELLDDKYTTITDVKAQSVNALVKEQNMPYRMDEGNNFGDGGIGVSERFASALWGLDFMFTLAKNNSQGVNFHGGRTGFTPIVMSKTETYTPRPLYYAMLFFHLASQGALLPVSNSDNSGNLKTYAVLGADHHVYLTIINKNVNDDANIHVVCKNKLKAATLMQLSSPSVTSMDTITLGGSSIDKLGNWKPSVVTQVYPQNGAYDIKVPKGSATLVNINNF